MKFNSQRLGAILAISVLVLGYFLYGRRADPKDRVVGLWKVNPQSGRTQGAEFGLKADIRKDGTFVLTGNRVFESMSGAREIHGQYKFVSEGKIRVEMDTRAWDYEPTVYSISEISKSELVLNAEEYSVSMIRAD